MSLGGRNCGVLSCRGAILTTIRAHNPVSMIKILTFSPTTFIPELFVAVASLTKRYGKTRLTNDVLFFSPQEMENVLVTTSAFAIPPGRVAHAVFLIAVL